MAILILLNNKYKTDHTSFENQLFTIVKNAVFGWFTLVYLVSAPYYLYNYTFVWAIIPMYGIIYAANKSKLVFGEFLGLGYGIILISGISYSAEQADSFRFALQPLWGKIVMAEVLISLWFLKLFYQKFLPASAHLKAMNVVREIFYWIVPLLILSPVNRHYPTYFETALWISTGISFGLNQLTKHKSLVMEVFALAAIATVLTLTQSENLWGVFSSIAILSALWISQKAHHPTRWLSSKYKSLLEIIPYYFAACIFVVTEAFLHSNSDACVATAIFLSSILLLQKHIAPMQKSLGFGFIVLLIVTGFSIGAKQLEHSGLPESVTLLPFIPIGLLIYLKNSIIRLKKLQLWSQSILVFHALLLIGYSFVFAKSVLTVAIILHAIILLFNSLKQNIKGMVWLSIAFFGVAVTKLYVWDIAHFTMIQKVLVFVLIGALLLGASYLFVKLKDNFEASKVNEQDLK